MPPFQSRSAGARRIAWISSVGVSRSASTPSAARACGESGTDFAERGQMPPPAEITARSKSSHDDDGRANIRSRSANVASGSGSGSMKTWRWSNAARSRICRDSSMPFPNTSPDMSPTPTAVNGSVMTSRPSSRKWRVTLSHAPRAVMPSALWSYPSEPPDAYASPSQNPYSALTALAVSDRWAVPLSAATTRYGSGPSRTRTPGGWTTSPPTMLSVRSSIPRIRVMYWRRSSSISALRSDGGRLSTKPPLAPTGTITAFLTICAFIRPSTSVR